MKAKLLFSSTLFLLTVSGINPQLALAEGGKVFDRFGSDGRPNWTEESIQDLERKIQENKLKRMQEESQARAEQIGQIYRPQVRRPLPIPPKPVTMIEETKTLPEINLVEKIEIQKPVEVILAKKPIVPIAPLSKKEEYLLKMNNKLVDKYKKVEFNIDPANTYKKESIKSLRGLHFIDAYRYHKAQKYANDVYLEQDKENKTKETECKTPSRLSSWFSNIKKALSKKSSLSPDFLKNCVASYEGGYTHEGMLRLTPSLTSFPSLSDNLNCKDLDPDVFAKIVKDQFKAEYAKNPSLKELLGKIASIESDDTKKEITKDFITKNPDLYARTLQPFIKVAKTIHKNEATTKMGEAAMTNLFFMMLAENPLDKNSPETQGMLWILKHLE